VKNSDFKKGEDVNSAKWYHALFLVENSLIIRFHWQRIKKKYKKYNNNNGSLYPWGRAMYH